MGAAECFQEMTFTEDAASCGLWIFVSMRVLDEEAPGLFRFCSGVLESGKPLVPSELLRAGTSTSCGALFRHTSLRVTIFFPNRGEVDALNFGVTSSH